MAVIRLARAFVSDVPLAVIAIAAFALTLFASTRVSRWSYWALDSPMSSGRTESASCGSANSISLAPFLAGLALGAVSLSLTSEIFWEGLKAGLVTFGGAFTVIPYLQDVAVVDQGWLTEGQFVDGLAMSGVLPAPLIIFSTFVGYIAGGMAGALR